MIYTAIFGAWDILQDPSFIPKNCDFICFTDSSFKSNIWQVRRVKPPHSDPVRSARKYKILAHRFLPEYEYSVWVDGNMIVRGDVNLLIEKYLNNCNMAVYNHTKTKGDARDCIYEEARVLINKKYKDDPELIRRQIEKYRNDVYPEHNGLLSSMVMLRRHNEPDVVKTMEDWWGEIKEYSRRDQLSFNYVAWKNKLKFVYMEDDSRDNDFFLFIPHRGRRASWNSYWRYVRRLCKSIF